MSFQILDELCRCHNDFSTSIIPGWVKFSLVIPDMQSNVLASGRRVEIMVVTLPAQGPERGTRNTNTVISLERAFLCLERPDSRAGPLLLWFASLAKEKLARKTGS
jgi:hypothetical protein